MKIGRSLNENVKCPTCTKFNTSRGLWSCAFCEAGLCAHCYWKHTEADHPNENVVPSGDDP